MEDNTRNLLNRNKQPWVLSVIFAAAIPLFPEYFAPILAIGSLMAACYDSGSLHDFKVGTLGKIMLVYIAYTAIGLLYTPNFLSTLATVSMWITMFTVYLSITTVLRDSHRFDTALVIISVFFGVTGLIGCVQYMLRISLGLNVPFQFWSFIDDPVFEFINLDLKPAVSRVSSTFNNPNIFSEALVMALPLVAYCSFFGKNKKYHLLCRFCLMFIAAGIAFSFSRGSYLALIAIALVFCLTNIKKIVFVLLTIISGLFLVPETVMDRLFSISSGDQSISERLSIWLSSASFIKSNPIFGIGAGVRNTWNLLLQKGIDAPHMHNIALQLLTEGGIIALVIFMVAGWKVIRSGFAIIYKNPDTRETGVLLIAIVLGFAVNGFFDFPLMTPKLVGIFFVGTAVCDTILKITLGQKQSTIQNVLKFQKQIITVSDERVAYTNYQKSNKI